MSIKITASGNIVDKKYILHNTSACMAALKMIQYFWSVGIMFRYLLKAVPVGTGAVFTFAMSQLTYTHFVGRDIKSFESSIIQMVFYNSILIPEEVFSSRNSFTNFVADGGLFVISKPIYFSSPCSPV